MNEKKWSVYCLCRDSIGLDEVEMFYKTYKFKEM